MILRSITARITKLLKKFPVVTLTGPRQSGKTTLLKKAFPEYKYFNLENPNLRTIVLEDPLGFLNSNGRKIILDEVQRVPELFSYIQTIVDENQNISFILSGSQHFLLMEQISQSLAGRTAIFHLLPLTMAELAGARKLDENLEVNIWKGGYPRLYDKDINPTDFFPAYIQSYIERDVRLIRDISDPNSFQRYLQLAAGRVGQLLNFNDLARDAGISPKTAKEWLSILEKSYVVFFLQPFHKNFNKRLSKSPKLYFYDTGLLCSLLRVFDHNQLFSHYARGHIFENAIIAELKKQSFHKGNNDVLYFWRDNHKNEVDLIIDKGNNIYHAIEIKSSKTMRSDFMKNLHWFDSVSSGMAKEKYVVYGGDENLSTSKSDFRSWKTIIS